MTIGWKTLDVGAEALVYDHQGEARIENGPKRLFLWREKFIPLQHYSASQNEYLRIHFKDGTIKHQHGPATVFFNPLLHQKIRVLKGIHLDANEVLVVYKQISEKGVSRSTQHGPMLFIPESNEWLHEFNWSGPDPENKTRMIPGNKVFKKLQIIPDQFYFNVDEVRTADEALIRVKLMMFFELNNIETMLNETFDPIADFVNCLRADVVAFCGRLSYMEFINGSEKLNNLECYPQLLAVCERIGFNVNKVVFRGYYASHKLQHMHDEAIIKRTQLRLEFEEEEQKQMLAESRIKIEIERNSKEQALEIEKLDHKNNMEKDGHEHSVLLAKQTEMETIQHAKALEIERLEAEREKENQQIKHLQKLKNLGVELNSYTASLSNRPDKVVVINNSGNTANLHLHHSQ